MPTAKPTLMREGFRLKRRNCFPMRISIHDGCGPCASAILLLAVLSCRTSRQLHATRCQLQIIRKLLFIYIKTQPFVLPRHTSFAAALCKDELSLCWRVQMLHPVNSSSRGSCPNRRSLFSGETLTSLKCCCHLFILCLFPILFSSWIGQAWESQWMLVHMLAQMHLWFNFRIYPGVVIRTEVSCMFLCCNLINSEGGIPGPYVMTFSNCGRSGLRIGKWNVDIVKTMGTTHANAGKSRTCGGE